MLVGSTAIDGECISYITDISARKHDEQTLRTSEAQYRALFDHSPFPKLLFDNETLCFLAVNDAAVAHYGYSRDEFLQMTIADVRPRGDVPAFLASIAIVGRHEPWGGLTRCISTRPRSVD